MKKLICFLILTAVIFCAVSCGDADIVIRTKTLPMTSTEKAAAEISNVIIVNRVSGVFHISNTCSGAASMKEENRLELEYGNIADAISDGYKPCGICAKMYKTEE